MWQSVASCRILIVDDHPLMRDAVRSVIWEFGSGAVDAIHDVDSGEMAVTHARVCEPQLILMDIGLPGINGLEAARRIRRESSAISIVMMTAVEKPGQREEGIQLGTAGFVVKDHLVSELPRVILAVLGPE